MEKTAEETLQGNKLIAEFMGWKKSPYPNLPNKMYQNLDDDNEIGISVYELKYHTSWDWLIPVVEKIESIGDKIYSVEISLFSCCIYNLSDLPSSDYEPLVIESHSESKIEATWEAVVEFIQRYNNQKFKSLK